MSTKPTPHPTGAITSLDDPPLLDRTLRFHDRRDAGRQLAALLERFRKECPVIVGIARGGVPVAAEVARALDAPLDVALVRKIGAPGQPEFAIGALAEGDVCVLSRQLVAARGLSETELDALLASDKEELSRRLHRYRGEQPPVDIAGRTAILVDDGLATGRSAQAAVRSLRLRGAGRVVLAVPVAAAESAQALRAEADEVVCVEEPPDLWAVGYWYQDFSATPDEEVVSLLAQNRRSTAAEVGLPAGVRPASDDESCGGDHERTVTHELSITLSPSLSLDGDLSVPRAPRGVVVFAHGSGSGRLSPRNCAVAGALCDAGFATLLFDLLTPHEETDRANVFDIPLLAARLLGASGWLAEREEMAGLPLAYFGASTGAAAALTAAAELGERVSAVVSRGGRPDLATNLQSVRAPTLLIVGGADRQVLELNREAQRELRCPNELALVPGATHLFEEPGALERVARLAIDWLTRYTR